MSQQPTIGLVDDDPDMLKALRRLLMAKGYLVRGYHSSAVFLEELKKLELAAVVLDLSMPDLNGLELQERMKKAGSSCPIIFLTGRGDIPSSVRAIKAGAVNFLTKPVDDRDLLEALEQAMEMTGRLRAEANATAEERVRLAKLTPREYEVLQHVITGRLNKQIAAALGASEQTIKIHRMRLTEKLGCPSVAELVRLAQRQGVSAAD